MRLQKLKDDQGSAILEFLVIGIALNVGILIFSANIMQVQRDQMVIESIARHASRLISRGGSESDAKLLANQISKQFGYLGDEIALQVSCSSAACDQFGDFVRVTVATAQSTTSTTIPVTEFASASLDLTAVDDAIE
jgi:Flp pilus assembly protein TadG